MDYIVALGGNLGPSEELFERSIELVQGLIGEVAERSRWYVTEPLLPRGLDPDIAGQPNYLNGVLGVSSHMPPLEVMRALLEIERRLGRDRRLEIGKWQSRLIDLDLIAAEDAVIESDELVLPHPEMHRRRFVLEPMMEIAPNWRHPVLNKTTAELFKELCSAAT